MTILLHITSAEAWQAAQAIGEYRPPTFDSEGFIHCSTPGQVVGVANVRFAGIKGLRLLRINAHLLKAKVVYENLEGGKENFPHIYGPLNLEAVTGVFDFEYRNGTFILPPQALGA